ncbi:MAG: metallophosphoesterase [Fimbriimonadaceae bacterium]|nr:metallophosphoesterase [Fimbriimonadaceae bacterium]
MRLAHISDTHLGYRAYSRTTSQGLNLREFDVMRTFKESLLEIAACDPDFVLHTGDFFHVVRPSNHTINTVYRALRGLQEKRNFRPFLILGGNHDTPRLSDSGNILRLFETIDGVKVCPHDHVEVVDYPDLDLEVMAVSSRALDGGSRNKDGDKVSWSPTGRRKRSVLAVHGVAEHVLRAQKHAGGAEAKFDAEELNGEQWTYVGLGDFHVRQELARNCFYVGSTDFTTSNVWEEIGVPKAWLLYDLDAGKAEIVPTRPRMVIDLPPIKGKDRTAREIEDLMRRNATWNPEDVPLVRQRVYDIHPQVRSEIDPRLLRELQETCLYYRFSPFAPESTTVERPTGERVDSRTLETEWDDHVRVAEMPPGVERQRVRDLGCALLTEVSDAAR